MAKLFTAPVMPVVKLTFKVMGSSLPSDVSAAASVSADASSACALSVFVSAAVPSVDVDAPHPVNTAVVSAAVSKRAANFLIFFSPLNVFLYFSPAMADHVFHRCHKLCQ